MNMESHVMHAAAGTAPARHAGFPGHDVVVITCEHGGNRIPPAYRDLFRDAGAQLHSHRGYDAGALGLARELAGAMAAPLFVSVLSRLLIDLNRSPGHPKLYSEFTRPLPPALRRQIAELHYLPYRRDVETCIAGAVAQGLRVLHVSSHSFTPSLGGKDRLTDIGLLYDPSRAAERAFCRRWQSALGDAADGFRTRLNYPYAGRADGLTTWLRRRFGAEHYLGVEIEVNQKHVRTPHWRPLRAAIVEALRIAAASPAYGIQSDRFS